MLPSKFNNEERPLKPLWYPQPASQYEEMLIHKSQYPVELLFIDEYYLYYTLDESAGFKELVQARIKYPELDLVLVQREEKWYITLQKFAVGEESHGQEDTG